MSLKDTLLLRLLIIINHILECKIGLCKAHALHPGDLVILVLSILQVHEGSKVAAAALRGVVGVIRRLVLVLLQGNENIWLVHVLG
jgi:hypothetical protein